MHSVYWVNLWQFITDNKLAEQTNKGKHLNQITAIKWLKSLSIRHLNHMIHGLTRDSRGLAKNYKGIRIACSNSNKPPHKWAYGALPPIRFPPKFQPWNY